MTFPCFKSSSLLSVMTVGKNLLQEIHTQCNFVGETALRSSKDEQIFTGEKEYKTRVSWWFIIAKIKMVYTGKTVIQENVV